MSPRYAIYFAPAHNSPLNKVAVTWLGRDAYRDTICDQPAIPGLTSDEQRALTAEPRRYGFHATLKAPFRLKESVCEADLLTAVDEIASDLGPATAPAMKITELGNFLALVPAFMPAALETVADAVVRDLDRLRAPLTPADLARRQPASLSKRQQQFLNRWGYPYVFEEFRLHMTLTGPLPDIHRDCVIHSASEHFARFLGTTLAVDAVSVFIEDAPGAPFRALARLPLKGQGRIWNNALAWGAA